MSNNSPSLPNNQSATTLFKPEEAAEYLKLSPNTLRRWRWLGVGPEFVKVGGRVRYRQKDLESYLSITTQHTVTMAECRK